jgi:hypothetical protein
LVDQSQREAELGAAKAVTAELSGPLLQAYGETLQIGKELHKQQQERANMMGTGLGRWKEISEANKETNGSLETYSTNLSETSGKLSTYLINLKNASEQIQEGNVLTENQITALDGSQIAFDNSTESTKDMSKALEGVLAYIKKFNAALLAQKAKELNLLDEKDVAKAKEVVASLLTEAEKVKGAMAGTNDAINNATTILPVMQIAVGNVATATDGVKTAWDGVIGKIKQAAAAAVNAIAQISAATAAASAGKASAGNYRGGMQYLAMGGQGQDTIPAMLSPGEFVINADSSKKFFSELNAINSGGQPVYREQGGSITNVGDVNVTVNGGDSSQQTVREIGHALRRELRRGTIKL